MKKIIVTGASGFIGRQAVRQLVGKGWEVHAFCYPAAPVETDGATWHIVNLLDQQEMRDAIMPLGATHLLHLAWYVEHGKYWTAPENFRWVAATLALAEEFRKAGGWHMVGAGTLAEYDWNFGYLRENETPMIPATVYGQCKYNTFSLLSSYGAATGMRVAWGRVFYLYGPHEGPARLVSSVIVNLLKGQPAQSTHGRQVRSFLHVADVAKAFVCLCEQEVAGAFNIGSGEAVTLRQVAEFIGAELGAESLLRIGALPAREDEPPVLLPDIRRIAAEALWQPDFDLKSGLRDTISWWKRNPPF